MVRSSSVSATTDLLEISDLIVDYEVGNPLPTPVDREQARLKLYDNGQHWAARYVSSLPARDGILDADHCNALLLRAHIELQRLSEEFLQVDRLRAILLPVVRVLRNHGSTEIRIVDVGCGLGYLVRALTAHGRLGRDVQLHGCDFNAALIAAARKLADEESLGCEFSQANAFELGEGAHIFISTGVLHHFRGPRLADFFRQQNHAAAFVHFDIQTSPFSGIGSWLYHRTRMREPLARHDGVVSAQRAHPATTLMDAARHATALSCGVLDRSRNVLDVAIRPLQSVIGIKREWSAELRNELGPLQSRVEGLS